MRSESKRPWVANAAETIASGGFKALKASCVVMALTLVAMQAVADDCSDGCEAQSRNGYFQVMAMPAEGDIALREHHDWILTVQDAEGSPVMLDGLSVAGGMPGHGHGLPSQPKVAEYLGEGRYRFTGFLFNMHGDWTLRFHMGRGGVQDVADVTLTLDY